MSGVFIIDAVRTPIGKIGGALAGVRPDDLGGGVIAALVERNGWLDPIELPVQINVVGSIVFLGAVGLVAISSLRSGRTVRVR